MFSITCKQSFTAYCVCEKYITFSLALLCVPEREYQCLGQWTEDRRIYALTFRRDIRTYECFVGVIRPDGTVFIKEAESEAGCSRNVQPEVLGMKLQRKGEKAHCRYLLQMSKSICAKDSGIVASMHLTIGNI